ncbi:MAG TPA: LLM class flavin-dependent oxidoreductase [Candidatus Limnocylindrales bacterium]|nr:LLM class flavin-dependent oxidoreductase [Candidatus Limnocylindrales bacterium]
MNQAPSLRLGLNLPYTEGQMDGATPRWTDIRAMAVAAEVVGFDAVWISDHVGFGDPASPEPGRWSGAWDCWTLLAALAAVTTRVHLGTYVLCTAFRNPALLAKMAETLDEVSGGRVILGLGAGWNEIEFSSYGYPYAERFGRFEDSLRIIAAMLRTGRATYNGRWERAADARIEPRGPRAAGLPIMVGAGGPRMLRLTAELADRWNGGMGSVAGTIETLAALNEACRAVGRDPASIERSVEVLVRPGPAPADEQGEPNELRGSPIELAASLLAYRALGVGELQVQLRPNTLAAIDAFAPVIAAIRRG